MSAANAAGTELSLSGVRASAVLELRSILARADIVR